MAQLDPSIPLQAFSQRKRPSMLDQLQQAAPIADFMQKQRQQEQMADIFGRNIQRTPEGGLEMNRQSALSELYGTQPVSALEFEKGWASAEKAGQGREFAPMLKVDEQGYFRQFNPNTLTFDYQLDQAGQPVKSATTYGTQEGEDQFWKFDKRTGQFIPTGITPGGTAARTATTTKTYEDIKTEKIERTAKEQKTVQDAIENYEKHIASRQANEAKLTALGEVSKLARDIANNPNLKYTTGWKALVGQIPETEAAKLNADLESLRNSGVIETLGQLKSQSATGATGFGALSEGELKIIKSAMTRLNSKLSPADKKAELLRIATQLDSYQTRISKYESEKQKMIQKYNPDYTFGGTQPTGPKAGSVVDGYRFKGGNPNDQTAWEKVK